MLDDIKIVINVTKVFGIDFSNYAYDIYYGDECVEVGGWYCNTIEDMILYAKPMVQYLIDHDTENKYTDIDKFYIEIYEGE